MPWRDRIARGLVYVLISESSWSAPIPAASGPAATTMPGMRHGYPRARGYDGQRQELASEPYVQGCCFDARRFRKTNLRACASAGRQCELRGNIPMRRLFGARANNRPRLLTIPDFRNCCPVPDSVFSERWGW